MNRAVFLDRDGVITQEPPHYAHKLSQLKIIPGTAAAIRRLNENGYLVVVVTNQAGIARGYYREEDAAIFNRAMQDELAKAGARVDAVYFCPHHPEATVEKYRKACDCRKPEPGMLLKAEKELGVDLQGSFMIGDKMSDITAGERAGCKTIFVKTGADKNALEDSGGTVDYIAGSLLDAVRYIIGGPGESAD